MEIVLARILKYLNGALFYDDHYRFCTYLVDHYLEILDREEMTKEDFLKEAGIGESNMDDFIRRLTCSPDWASFRRTLAQDHLLRLDQIRGRMVGLRVEDLAAEMEKDVSDEEMLAYVSMLCKELDRHERIVLIGALYPMSIAVEFQTDLIILGKNVVQFHNYDPNMQFTKKDLLVFISATGRFMKGFLEARSDLHPKEADSLLITQNPAYTMEEHQISDHVLKLPGRFDGLRFNYQLMHIFDLLRIQYYQQYYLGDR